MLASPLPPSFLNTHSLYHFSDVRLCESFLAFLPSFVEVLPLSISRMVPSILQGQLPRCLSFCWVFPFVSFISVYMILSASKYLQVYFSSSILILSRFGSLFFPLFVLSTSHYEYGTFFIAKFHSNIFNYYYILLLVNFFTPVLANGLSLERQQGFLGVLDSSQYFPDLNNIVLWMVSLRPLIFNSSSPLNKPLRIVASAPVTIGITSTFMPHRFLVLWEGVSTCLSFRFLWFSFCGKFSFIFVNYL